jgi:hypothetical protein
MGRHPERRGPQWPRPEWRSTPTGSEHYTVNIQIPEHKAVELKKDCAYKSELTQVLYFPTAKIRTFI